MPNWCDNSATLMHDDVKKIDALVEEMSKKTDDEYSAGCPFQHLRPRPQEEEDNWYDWNLRNWGTKWEADVIDWEKSDDNSVRIYFNSAWAPPTQLYEYLVENGWKVEALYHESGMGFAGQYINGDDDYYEYDLTNKESIDSLPTDIVEFAGLENAYEEYIDNLTTDVLWDLPRSEAIDGKIKPQMTGRYIIRTKQRDYDHFAEWGGKDWGTTWDGKKIKPVVWCGLTEELTEEKLEQLVQEKM